MLDLRKPDTRQFPLYSRAPLDPALTAPSLYNDGYAGRAGRADN
jgi:hypothetical protein